MGLPEALYILVETDSAFAWMEMEKKCAWHPHTIWQRQGGYRQQNSFRVQNASARRSDNGQNLKLIPTTTCKFRKMQVRSERVSELLLRPGPEQVAQKIRTVSKNDKY
ncbi:unnamed protein product [Phytophthora fragariaefolia]|uniref:Unnamed protein product n=1 Tax=Phytophthora fragariaefolia TaxID=1490495 RepID=A0A9W6YKW9_9STRA|nr:unnamed protein product [Phytophthora fragariaefolia]